MPSYFLHVHANTNTLMLYITPTFQILLFLVFAVGGAFRFFQPIDVLAKRMLWVKYFNPRVVRGIALIEVVCGIGIILPLILTNTSFAFLLYSGCLLMATMLGAVITHLWIGDYKQIVGNLLILAMTLWVTFPVLF